MRRPRRSALRIALLSMIEPASGDEPLPRAALRVGAGSVARHQLALALALDCQRIVCLTRGMSAEVADLQHVAEKTGAQFYMASNVTALLGQVTANDEVLAVTDGLFAMQAAAMALLAHGQGVLVQPVEVGLAAGFERIDANHAAAGMMLIPGYLVERLSELPPDCDTLSSLTRIALQAGVTQRIVPPEAREAFRWMLVRSEDEAHVAETGSVGQFLASQRPNSLGSGLAWLGVKAFGPALLHANGGGNALTIGGMLLLLLGLGAGWFEASAVALLFVGGAALLHLAAAMLLRMERSSLSLAPDHWLREVLAAWLLDGVIVAILAWSLPIGAGMSQPQRLFAPLILVALVRLLPKVVTAPWCGALTDRFALALVLAAAGFAGYIGHAVHFLALGFAALAVLVSGSASKLTRA